MSLIRISRRQGYPLPVLPDDVAWFWSQVCQAALTSMYCDVYEDRYCQQPFGEPADWIAPGTRLQRWPGGV